MFQKINKFRLFTSKILRVFYIQTIESIEKLEKLARERSVLR
jgi:hypothetical protein